MIPNGCVLLLTGSRHLTRPWGCGRLSDLRPALVVHGDAQGAERGAATFFGKVTPVGVGAGGWVGGAQAGEDANNGGASRPAPGQA